MLAGTALAALTLSGAVFAEEEVPRITIDLSEDTRAPAVGYDEPRLAPMARPTLDPSVIQFPSQGSQDEDPPR